MIAIVHGPDAATARAEVAALVRAHDPAGTSTSRLDGRVVGVPQILGAVASVGFFAEPRVIVVEDFLSRTAKTQDGDADAKGKPATDFAALFAAVPADNVLVFLDQTLAALPVAVRKSLPAQARVIACEPPRGAALIDWLVRIAKDNDADLSPRVARGLAERLYPQTWSTKPNNPAFDRPPDLDRLANEIAKLALATHPSPISSDVIDAMVPAGDNDQLFRFAEAVAAGAVGPATVELGRLLDAGEEPFKLAAQVQQQAELAIVAAAAGGRADPVGIGKALGLTNPNRMIGVVNAQRRLPPGMPRAALGAAIASDRGIKRGLLRQPEDSLYALIAATGSAAGTPKRGDT